MNPLNKNPGTKSEKFNYFKFDHAYWNFPQITSNALQTTRVYFSSIFESWNDTFQLKNELFLLQKLTKLASSKYLRIDLRVYLNFDD